MKWKSILASGGILLCMTVKAQTSATHQDSVLVYGTVKNSTRDTFKIVLNENLVVRKQQTFYVPLNNGSFRFSFPLQKLTYFYLNEGSNYVNGAVAPGDEIDISYDAKDLQSSLEFTGNAAEKFKWVNELAAARLHTEISKQAKIASEKQYPFDYVFSFFDSVQHYYLSRLKKIPDIDSQTLYLLQSHVEGSIQHYKYSAVTYVFKESVETTLQTRGAQLTAASRAAIKSFTKFREDYYNSPIYINSVYNILYREYLDRQQTEALKSGLKIKYHFLDSMLPGKLKVPVLTMFFETDILNGPPSNDLLEVMDHLYANASDPIYHEYIQRFIAGKYVFKKGTKAPDFQLENEKGEKVNLASFKGKVIYLDFWFGACAPCHALFGNIKPVKEHFKGNEEVVFLTVSVDDKETWKQSLKKFNIPGYHVYTEDRERRHPVIAAYRVSGYPTTFLIDKQGNIFIAGPSGMPDVLTAQINEALKL